jgi:CRP-like cAMP-binding protein
VSVCGDHGFGQRGSVSALDGDRLRGNHLIDGLPAQERERLGSIFDRRSFTIRDLVYAIGEPTRAIIFPIDSIFSLLSEMQDGRAVEVATVGNEGFVGVPAFLQGSFTNAHTAFCQIAGEALIAETAPFFEIVNGSSALHAALHRYTLALLTQIAQSSACNRLHAMQQRCVRWILMSHDRVSRDEFTLSQEFMAQMLGVRRATVSEAVSPLQAEGLIRYQRGAMTILDRPGLEQRACECYRIIQEEHRRLTDLTRP